MLRHVGWGLQLAALACLPALIVWQLTFGIHLLVMPALTVAAFLVFKLGQFLRER